MAHQFSKTSVHVIHYVFALINLHVCTFIELDALIVDALTGI